MPAFNYKTEYERYKKYYQDLTPALQKPAGRAYTTIIFSFLVVSLFGWYAIRPTMQTIFTLRREIEDKTGLDKKMEDKISSLIEAHAVYQSIEDKIPLVSQALPTSPDPVQAIAQIRALGHESSINFSRISVPPLPLANAPTSPTAQVVAKKLTSFPLSFSINGTFPSVKIFLQGLLDLRRQMSIESMTFAPQRAVAVASDSAELVSGTTVQVDLKVNVYYLTK